MLCRFLVGLTEGPFLPAVSLMTSSWYTKEETPLRMAIWHAGNIISNVFSGLIAAGVLTNMDNVRGLHSWQWFIVSTLKAKMHAVMSQACAYLLSFAFSSSKASSALSWLSPGFGSYPTGPIILANTISPPTRARWRPTAWPSLLAAARKTTKAPTGRCGASLQRSIHVDVLSDAHFSHHRTVLQRLPAFSTRISLQNGSSLSLT